MESLGDRSRKYLAQMMQQLSAVVVAMEERDVELDDAIAMDRESGEWELLFAALSTLLKVGDIA